MKIDLHTHTLRSKDCSSSYDDIIRTVQQVGLHGIAVTDHNELSGAKELAQVAPFMVIPAEEIKTSDGEIIGLFLQERIEPGLPPLETVRQIKVQGGLVYVPHPFDQVRGSHLTRRALDTIRPHIDLLEVYNARCALPSFNSRALAYANEHRIAAGAGSDAHTYGEYGHAYIDVPDFHDAETFRRALSHGSWQGRLSSPLVHARTSLDKVMKRW
ncbi:MAG: PHP domain-containing protein [Chloroflexota bacterium]